MSTASDFDRCPTCNEFGWLSRHTCPPVYECRMIRDSDDLEWTRIHSTDSEAASEKFVKRWFWDGGYECFKDGERVTVEVRKGSGPIEIFEVLGEQTMEFHANEGDLEDVTEDAETEAMRALAVALVSIQLLAWKDEAARKYMLSWSIPSKIRIAQFHFQHLCDLKGIDPDDEDVIVLCPSGATPK